MTTMTSTAPGLAGDGSAWPAVYRAGYLRRWAQIPGTLVYLLLTTVLGWVSFSVILTMSVTAISLLVFVAGVFIWWATAWVTVGFNEAERGILRLTGLAPVERPRYRPDDPQAGVLRRAVLPWTDGHRWAGWLHALFVAPILGTVTFTIGISWAASALFSLTEWFWSSHWELDSGYQWVTSLQPDGWDAPWLQGVVAFVVGVILLVTLPWVVTGLGAAHHAIARGMLGRWPSDDLAEQAAAAEASRDAAVTAEDTAVRRLERDLHDGPQQRLLRLQMDLAAMERALDRDPDAARELAAQARNQGQETLAELRALISGMAPPLLQDRGLAVALHALAARSTVPAVTRIEVREDTPLPSEVERSAYFVISELLTNVAKHSGASQVRVSAVPSATGPGSGWLELQVSDNGRGGAAMTQGRGLAGLRDRVHGLRGTFVLASPDGGPTEVTVRLPYGSAGATDLGPVRPPE